tara:strand:- start:93088 stop:96150 length:3063 start_codon:yes stop_codon:yes gene_type:complete
MRNLILILLFLISIVTASGQTGPAGVGSALNNLLWLDANQMGLNDNDAVATWLDISGNVNHATQITGSKQPIFKVNQVNNLPSVQFDGSNDNLELTTHITTSAITFFIVYKHDNSTQDGVFNVQKHALTDKANLAYLMSLTPTSTHYVTKPSNLFSIISSRSSALGAGTRIQISNNGSLRLSNRADFLSLSKSIIGSRWKTNNTADTYLDGDISELIIYDEDLSLAERTIILESLGAKYNFTVSPGIYSYKATHPNDVIGIGMESDGSNTSAKGRGSITISNPSSLSTGDYLLIGHDGGAFTTSVDVPLGTAQRFNRTWRVDETGETGTLDIQFDLGANGFSADGNYVLLIENNDGVFNNGDVVNYISGRSYDAGNATVSFTNIPFSDGDYFTLAEETSPNISISSGDWTDPSVWSCGCLPGATESAKIKATHTITVNTSSSIENLEIDVGGTLILDLADPSPTLDIHGDWTVNGSFVSNSGTIDATSVATPQSFYNSSGSSISLANLSVNNAGGLSIASGDWTLSGNLQVSSGGLDVSSANSFTLISNNEQTSQILTSMSNAFIGDFTIQRFIGDRNAGWCNISAPISNSIFNDLDDDGLFISGIGGVNGTANRVGTGLFYSIRNYNPHTDAEENITSKDASMVKTSGYNLYLQTSALPNPTPTFTSNTIAWTGTPNNGDVQTPFSNQINTGWNLLGNPYHSHIDWDLARGTQNAISESYYVWNTDNGSYDFETGGAKRSVAPEQGFWVFQSSPGGRYVTFKESNKVNSNSSAFFRTRKPFNQPEFSLKSKVNNFKHSMYIRPDFYATDGLDELDAPFLKSHMEDAPAITSRAKNSEMKLISNSFNPLKESQIIPISIYAGVSGDHEITTDNIDELYDNYSCIYLKDKLNDQIIDLIVDPIYNFDTQKGYFDRFELILSNNFNSCQKIIKNQTFVQNLDYKLKLRNSHNQWYLDYTLGEEITQVRVQIFNMAGQQVKNETSTSLVNSGSIPIDNLDGLNGIYLIHIVTKNKILSKRIKL